MPNKYDYNANGNSTAATPVVNKYDYNANGNTPAAAPAANKYDYNASAPKAAPVAPTKAIVAPTPSPTTNNFPGLGGAPVGAPPTNLPTPAIAPTFSQTPTTGVQQPFSTPFQANNAALAKTVASQISDTFSSSFNYGVQGATEIGQGEDPLSAIASAAKVGTGVFGVAFSWAAPLLNMISTGIKVAGAGFSETPLGKEYNATATPTDVKVLTALQDLGGMVMGILGAKGGEAKVEGTPQAQIESLVQHPDVIAAAQKVLEAKTSTLQLNPGRTGKPTIQLPAEQPAVSDAAIPLPEKNPATTNLLPEGKPNIPVQGDNFTMTDKADPQKVAIGKAQNTYDTALSKYTDNSTPKNLAAVLKARDALKTAQEPPAPVEAPKPVTPPVVAPKEVAPAAPKTAPTTETPFPSKSGQLGTTPDNSGTTIDRPVLPDGTRVTKVANDINQHLVDQGIKELPPEQQARYTSGSYKDSKAQADALAQTNRASLDQMALGKQDFPAGVHPQIGFNVVRDLAKAEKNYPLLQELANSPLATERSESAAKLGSAGYGQERGANAEIDALRKAQESKSGGVKGAKDVTAKAKEAKATITKTAAKMIDYQKILDAVTC